MLAMKHPRIASLPRGPSRGQRLIRVAHARHQRDRALGRAWINGREVGGADPRFAHLAINHD